MDIGKVGIVKRVNLGVCLHIFCDLRTAAQGHTVINLFFTLTLYIV